MAEKDGRGNVKVVARFRPQLSNELMAGGTSVASFDGSGKSVTIDGQRKAAFTFDRVFAPDCTQEEVYQYAAKPIVEDVLRGYNGTLFAYGQTSSGKTHTMEGPDPDGPDRGLIPRIIYSIFGYIEIAPDSYEFTVRVSYFEIYMEKIRDLLCDGNENLQIHENRERGVYVRHATELFMQDPEEVMEVMRAGAYRRSTASTNMNDQSSRSHSVFLLELTQKDMVKGGQKTGKLYLVDLAGSEKVSKTGADGEVLEEAKNINKSLSALGLVIMSLTDGTTRQHVPYRDSKLTRILQESLGGNSRTTIVICCSPSSYNEQETFSTLRFGQRAKKIKNMAVVNVQYSAEELQKQLDAAKKEIRQLAKRLAAAEAELQIWRSGGTVSEEDRVQLTTPDDAPIAMSLAAGELGGPQPLPGQQAVSDKELEEFQRRETELLELLDDKDEHIHSLEREIELLGQDKATLAKLAAENVAQRNTIKEMEERVEESLAENAEYEITIEDMARANNDLDEELARMKEEREKMLNDFETQQNKFQQQTVQIAEMIAGLSQPPKATGGRQLPSAPGKESGTVVDAQFSKARSYVQQLQAELAQAKEANTASEEAANKLESELEDAKLHLSEGKLRAEQTESKLAELTATNTSLTAALEEAKNKNDELNTKVTDMLAEMVAKEEALKQTEQAAQGEIGKGQAMLNEMKEKLEQQKKQERDEYSKQLADLKQQLEASKQEKDKIGEEKSKIELDLSRLQSELEKQKAINAKHQEKITQFAEKQEKEERIERETKGVSEATKQQLDAYEQLKVKMRQNLYDRLKSGPLKARMQSMMNKDKSAGEGGAGGSGGEESKHVQYLEKTNRELQTNYQDLQKQMAALQRDNAILQKKMTARGERIKNLESMMKKGEERLQKQFQIYLDENERLKKQGPQRKVIRKKSIKGGKAEQIPAIRGGSRDQGQSAFWNSQNSGTSPRGQGTPRQSASAAGAGGGIVGQGKPMVGQYAQPTKEVKGNDPLAVEFV